MTYTKIPPNPNHYKICVVNCNVTCTLIISGQNKEYSTVKYNDFELKLLFVLIIEILCVYDVLLEFSDY